MRSRATAHFLGSSDAADALAAAFRIPNLLQNLFGEGALSASFIPAYAALHQKDPKRADQLAGAVGAALALGVSVCVVIGVLGTPWLVDLVAPGFDGAKRDLVVRLVRILFPGIGLLVLSAWCLGVLNTHRRFFLSYVAPVLWNGAIIAALIYSGVRVDAEGVAVWAAWGSVAGSALQFLVQVPTVLRVAPELTHRHSGVGQEVREVFRNAVPAVVSRGVGQVSAYVDTLLASLLGTGAVADLTYAQTLYLLPVSLFGMSVSAAELPQMAREAGGTDTEALRTRIDSGLRQIAFFVVPSAAAMLVLGQVIAATIYQSGRFGTDDAMHVWAVLGGSAVGLLAATQGRLYNSAFYALGDPRTPLRYALVRVALTTVLGTLAALYGPALLHLDQRWGTAGLTATAGCAAWIEFLLLQRAMRRRIGQTGIGLGELARLWSLALGAAGAGWGMWRILPASGPVLTGALVLGTFGAVYLAGAAA
ncbi:MAG TPA: murein biosynthesis integral membrane protein MurJ, partial [Gemmatimonadales bacterium]|nr:murein biosynthesis integral membrane protein MurJ [Gemmatimonadales bacterium]